MELRLRALAERARTSLFYLPAVYVVLATIAARALVLVDGEFPDAAERVPLLVNVTVESARSILGTIAGATITVAGIVFSVTVVSVQLASSQFSPRVLRGFLRDRFQQNVIGLVIGTFTFCMLVLSTTRVSGPDPTIEPAPSLAVTVAIVLAVASILAIIGFIDHSARSMQVGHIITRVAGETRDTIARTCSEDNDDALSIHEHPLPDGPRAVIHADRSGWVQQIDRGDLARSLPPGSYARLDVRVGSFVTEGIGLCTYWLPAEGADHDGDAVARDLREEIGIGSSRTMQQDIAFGIRQLVDIALRALSPGINDPTTAIEVLVHLGDVLAELQRRHLPPRVLVGQDGQVVVAMADLTHADLIDRAFDQMRHAAKDHPAVLIVMLRVLGQLAILAGEDAASRRAPLERQARLTIESAERADHHPHDFERICAAAAAAGFADGEEQPPEHESAIDTDG